MNEVNIGGTNGGTGRDNTRNGHHVGVPDVPDVPDTPREHIEKLCAGTWRQIEPPVVEQRDDGGSSIGPTIVSCPPTAVPIAAAGKEDTIEIPWCHKALEAWPSEDERQAAKKKREATDSSVGVPKTSQRESWQKRRRRERREKELEQSEANARLEGKVAALTKEVAVLQGVVPLLVEALSKVTSEATMDRIRDAGAFKICVNVNVSDARDARGSSATTTTTVTVPGAAVNHHAVRESPKEEEEEGAQPAPRRRRARRPPAPSTTSRAARVNSPKSTDTKGMMGADPTPPALLPSATAGTTALATPGPEPNNSSSGEEVTPETRESASSTVPVPPLSPSPSPSPSSPSASSTIQPASSSSGAGGREERKTSPRASAPSAAPALSPTSSNFTIPRAVITDIPAVYSFVNQPVPPTLPTTTSPSSSPPVPVSPASLPPLPPSPPPLSPTVQPSSSSSSGAGGQEELKRSPLASTPSALPMPSPTSNNFTIPGAVIPDTPVVVSISQPAPALVNNTATTTAPSPPPLLVSPPPPPPSPPSPPGCVEGSFCWRPTEGLSSLWQPRGPGTGPPPSGTEGKMWSFSSFSTIDTTEGPATKALLPTGIYSSLDVTSTPARLSAAAAASIAAAAAQGSKPVYRVPLSDVVAPPLMYLPPTKPPFDLGGAGSATRRRR